MRPKEKGMSTRAQRKITISLGHLRLVGDEVLLDLEVEGEETIPLEEDDLILFDEAEIDLDEHPYLIIAESPRRPPPPPLPEWAELRRAA